MTVFPGSDTYRIRDVTKQRCALVLNFTTHKEAEDLQHRKAMAFLHELDKSRNVVTEVNNTEFWKEMAEEGSCSCVIVVKQLVRIIIPPANEVWGGI